MKINKFLILFFTLFLAFFVFQNNSFAATPAEVENILNELNKPYHKYFITEKDSTEYIYVIYSNSPDLMNYDDSKLVLIEPYGTSGTYKIHFKFAPFAYSYQSSLLDGTSKTVVDVPLRTENIGTNYNYKFADTILASELDFYMSDGTLFFQNKPVVEEQEKTLPVEMMEMVAQETPKMGEKTLDQMKIILLCGVGCLALLLVLPILLKVLYRFL